MPGFPFLDVAIAMIFVFLLLSLICSSLSEGFESFARFRVKDLEEGVRALLAEHNTRHAFVYLKQRFTGRSQLEEGRLTTALYRHPLIRSLYLEEHSLPNYIPARNFALALMDLLKTSPDLIRNAAGGPSGSSPVQVQIGAAPPPAAPTQPLTGFSLATEVDGVQVPEQLRTTLQSIIVASNHDPIRIRENIETWFNSTMDRSSGWYKRRVQYILFAIGVGVTIAVNADTIAILSHLTRTKNLQSIVSAATTASEHGASNPGPAAVISDLDSLDVGVGWIIPDAKLTSSSKGPRDSQNLAIDIRRAVPVWLAATDISFAQKLGGLLSWGCALLWMHAFGWLMTSAAIALGAPFWFDLLNRFIVVRSTVKPSEKSPDEKSKS